MIRHIALIIGLTITSTSALAAGEQEMVRGIARSFAAMDVAEAVEEACPGLYADERAMDEEEDRMTAVISSFYGDDKVEGFLESPTLERMTKDEQLMILSSFPDERALCASAAAGGVRFVTPIKPPPDPDEVDDGPEFDDEPG